MTRRPDRPDRPTLTLDTQALPDAVRPAIEAHRQRGGRASPPTRRTDRRATPSRCLRAHHTARAGRPRAAPARPAGSVRGVRSHRRPRGVERVERQPWLPRRAAGRGGGRRHLERVGRSIIANSARPVGRAVPDAGGFVLSGRWDIVSAIDAADWVTLFGFVMDGDGPRPTPSGAPDLRAFFLPRGEYAILDTWHTTGMRGTGSNTVVVDGAFVPEALTDQSVLAHPHRSAAVPHPGLHHRLGGIGADRGRDRPGRHQTHRQRSAAGRPAPRRRPPRRRPDGPRRRPRPAAPRRRHHRCRRHGEPTRTSGLGCGRP